MPAPDFVDTNVLVYAYDASDPRKQAIARDILRKAVAGGGVASSQVLAEFASTLLHKLSPPVRCEDLIALLDTLSPIKLVLPDGDLVRRAVEVRAAYGLHFYDGMIVAAAERAKCKRIWSEDLKAEQEYFGVTVVNPFKAA